MRILVHREHRGFRAATIIPSPGAHLPPLYVRAATKELLVERVRAALEDLRGALSLARETVF